MFSAVSCDGCELVSISVYVLVSDCFFFFKQKTAYEMRISDWSSDVCSSDLIDAAQRHLSGAVAFRAAGDQRKVLQRRGNRSQLGQVELPDWLDRKSVV